MFPELVDSMVLDSVFDGQDSMESLPLSSHDSIIRADSRRLGSHFSGLDAEFYSNTPALAPGYSTDPTPPTPPWKFAASDNFWGMACTDVSFRARKPWGHLKFYALEVRRQVAI
ncbi:conserved hypothetical protein [Histoplasma capsulatum H143]|uniref:Uncharacterized protein n=1 Tax=Ajellomyces capsulatus (strain H143) TaxID=544712 RepID=C6H2W0_AJECH|nr:conserved hypothetical protein [Histoplasma capsulatum H143]